MSASVVSLYEAREKLGCKRWSNQDVAEIYRVADTLRRAGLPVECDEGHTDEGDPWYAFCNVNTGDVIVHFALIDNRYLADVAHLSVCFSGDSLRDIVNQFLSSYPVLVPDQQSANVSRVWMHPASGLAAFVATLYFFLEMTRSVEAREVDRDTVVDGQSVVLSEETQKLLSADTDPVVVQNRDATLKWFRADSSCPHDGIRTISISVAAILAGVLLDRHRAVEKALAFEPTSILSVVLFNFDDDMAETITQALRSVKGAEFLFDGGQSGDEEAMAKRTAHLSKADSDLDIDGRLAEGIALDEAAGLVIDLDGEFGERGRPIGEELLHEAQYNADSQEAGRELGLHADGNDERPANTITAATGDAGGGSEAEGEHEPYQGGKPDNYGAEEFDENSDSQHLADAPESSTLTILQSLGLVTGSSATGSASEFESFVQLISEPAAGSSASAPSAPVQSAGDLAAASPVSAPPAATPTVVQSTVPVIADPVGGEPAGGISQTVGTSEPQTDFGVAVAVDSSPSVGDASGEPVVQAAVARDVDLSVFDPLDVLRLFVTNVEKVGYAHFDEMFYLYDAVALATEPDLVEVEMVELSNGDEVNLLGQAATFEAIVDALA